VEFAKRPGGGSVATITRPDGVRLRLTSYDRKYVVPHDLAHFATEQQLRMADGLWGSIAAGAVFDSVEVLSGTRAGVRSDAVRQRNAAGLALAEVLVGVVHGAVNRAVNGALNRAVNGALNRAVNGGVDGTVPAADRAVVAQLASAWGSVRQGPCPYPEAHRLAAVRELRSLGERFAALGPDEVLALRWPGGPEARGGRSGTGGRGVRRGHRPAPS